VESVEVVVSVLLLQEQIIPAQRIAVIAREFLFIMLILVPQHIKILCQIKLQGLLKNTDNSEQYSTHE
jgi:hypothetical protein